MSLLTGLIKKTALGKAGAGIAKLASREGFASAFSATPTGKIMSSVSSPSADKPKKTKSSDAAPVSKGPAGGGQISERALQLLVNIDDTLKRIIDTIDLQNQKEEAAREEAASEQKVPGPEPAQAMAAEKPDLLKRFGKFASLIVGFVLPLLVPIWNVLKSVYSWLTDMGMQVMDFLKEKILPILTEDIPKFFVETIPNFFTNTLPDLFFKGVDFMKDKIASLADSVTKIIGTVKGKVGGLILDIVDSPAAKFLLPDSFRNSIKGFANDMVKSGNETVKKSEENQAARAKAEAAKEQKQKEKTAKDAAPVEKKSEEAGKAVAEKVEAPAATGMSTTPPIGSIPPSGGMAGSAAGVGPSGGMATSSAGGAATGAGSTLPAPAPSSAGGMASTSQATPESSVGTSAVPGPSPSSAGGMASSAAASPVANDGTGKTVAAASMAATAPEPIYAPSVANKVTGSAPNMNKPKAPSSPVNPIANVPDVFPVLGSLADLWYHNSAVIV